MDSISTERTRRNCKSIVPVDDYEERDGTLQDGEKEKYSYGLDLRIGKGQGKFF